MTRRAWSEQIRISFWAWLATLGASVMIAPLVEKKTYLWHGALGAAVVVAVGAALRARRAPWPVVLTAQLAVLVEWVVLAYARGEAFLGVVPTRATVAEIASRVSDFVELTQQYAAPVPDRRVVTVVLALFVMALALVVDALAVTWRRVPLLGLVFLAIYMAPVALLGGAVSVFVFLPGAAGFVFLLAADERERLTHWGRQISAAGSVWDDAADEVNSGGIRTTGRRIGFGAVAASVVLPIIIPTLSPHYFGESSSGGEDGSGDGRTQVTNPVLDLKRNLTGQSDSVLVTFSTDQPDPSYLRIASLDDFTGELWSPGERPGSTSVPSDTDLPNVPGVGPSVARSGYRYDVSISDDLESRWLPLVYAPTAIESDQLWSVSETSLDATAADEDETTAGARYSFSAVVVTPTASLLRDAGTPQPTLGLFTDLPPGLPAVIAERAGEVTAGAATAFDKALALQSWFRSEGGFRYSLDAAPGTGMETIESFLTDNRVGYCEQFASAMALMARSLGIPARVAVGFLRPETVGVGEYVYRGTDMHAWPELYFEGAGWVRFEPTPATRTGAAPDFTPAGTGPTKSATAVAPTGSTRPSDDVATRETSTADAAASGSSGESGPWRAIGIGLGVVVLLLLAGAVPRLLRAVRSRARWGRVRRPADMAEAAWAELRDGVLDLRLPWDAGATPRGAGRQLRSQVSADEAFVRALNRIVLATEQGRYARRVRDADELREAVATVVGALTATRSPRLRWLSTWLPSSLVSRWRGTGSQPRAHLDGGDGLLTVAE